MACIAAGYYASIQLDHSLLQTTVRSHIIRCCGVADNCTVQVSPDCGHIHTQHHVLQVVCPLSVGAVQYLLVEWLARVVLLNTSLFV